MGKPPSRGPAEHTQNDPGESNSPRSSAGDFDLHLWTSLTQIFEKLGKIEEKVGHLTLEQERLKTSVEKHDKLILRAIFSVSGAIAILLALWFLYSNFLKDHLLYK